ncbi:MAG TPA: amidohydrolase family protein [Candidatus Binataceae bacterium]|nr:amidohydrolase family protein [Candidatus Binataceae bacterium]
MLQSPIISADSHFVEPPGMWRERIDARFRDRAPTNEPGPEGGEYLACEDIPRLMFHIGANFAAGRTTAELPKAYHAGWEAAPKSVWDPAERLKEQDRDGVAAEIMYGSQAFLIYGVRDAEFLMACYRAFNDWAAEYCSVNPERLLGIGNLVLDDVPAAIKELERIAKIGLRGAMIPIGSREEQPYTSPEFDPFWAAAQDLNMTLSMHAATSRTGVTFGVNEMMRKYVGLPYQIQVTICDLIVSGVFERFPRLKLVSAENDVSWLPSFVNRLDHGYDRLSALQKFSLAKLPGEYLRNNLAATFQFEGLGVDFARRALGSQCLMWSSDYPHNDSTWPRSREIIEENLGSLPPADLAQIVYGNAARLYDINLQ